MDNKIPIEELLYEEEGTTLDFKQEQYKFHSANNHEKSELLKDILAFSNAWRRVDAYILIGVKEIKGGRSHPVAINEDLDDAQLQQFVNSKTQRPIKFDYSTALVDGVKIGVLRIPVQTRPFYIERDYGKLKKHTVYIRRGSSTSEASPEEVRDMGRSEIIETEEIPNLNFEFANLSTRKSCGTALNINTILLNVPSKKEIPDYYDESNSDFMRASPLTENHSYYKELVKYYYILNKSKELAFLLRNESNKVISDIRVELIIKKEGEYFSFFKSSMFPEFPKSHYNIFTNSEPILDQWAKKNRRTIDIQDLGEHYRVEIPFEKVQPHQTVFSNETIYISVNEGFDLTASITIFADNIPIPIQQKISISGNVTKNEGSLEAIEGLHHQHLLTIS